MREMKYFKCTQCGENKIPEHTTYGTCWGCEAEHEFINGKPVFRNKKGYTPEDILHDDTCRLIRHGLDMIQYEVGANKEEWEDARKYAESRDTFAGRVLVKYIDSFDYYFKNEERYNAVRNTLKEMVTEGKITDKQVQGFDSLFDVYNNKTITPDFVREFDFSPIPDKYTWEIEAKVEGA